MIFDMLTKPVEAGLNVASDTFDLMIGEGDGPSRENVAELISAGLTVAAIAHGFGVAEGIITALVTDE